MEKLKKEKDSDKYQYLDNREYQAGFLLDPDIQSEADYSHMDKNLAMTNLIYNPKMHLDETNEARSVLRGLHVLNNPKHYFEEDQKVQIGWDEKVELVEGKETKVRIPVYEMKKVMRSKFPKVHHSMRSEFLSFVNTSAARNGHRIKQANTNRLVKEETIQQKTDVAPRFGWGGKR